MADSKTTKAIKAVLWVLFLAGCAAIVVVLWREQRPQEIQLQSTGVGALFHLVTDEDPEGKREWKVVKMDHTHLWVLTHICGGSNFLYCLRSIKACKVE